jgi:S-formylglutathione hydrolase FrmB
MKADKLCASAQNKGYLSPANKGSPMRLALILAIVLAPLFGAKIERIETLSQAMQKPIGAIVISPERQDRQMPAIYLLHGFGMTPDSWLEIDKTALTSAADKEKVLIVLVDGGKSWYLDAPNDKTQRYETYVTKELTAQIEAKYPAIANGKSRAIAGFSMGGHGALFLALKRADMYAAAGVMAGGVDLPPFYQYWDLTKLLGDPKANRQIWIDNSVLYMVDRYDLTNLKIRIDCGRDDFFYASNAALAAKLRDRNASFVFESRNGRHDRAFVKSALGDQLEFLIQAITADSR